MRFERAVLALGIGAAVFVMGSAVALAGP